MNLSKTTISLILIVFYVISCKTDKSPSKIEVLLAEYGKYKLYDTELQDLFPEQSSGDDSTTIINGYIDRWIRDKILLSEAERFIADRINVNKLVNDYRNSLLIHNYESQLVSERLDTMVTIDEKQAYYDFRKDEFKLPQPIINVNYAIVPISTAELKSFRNNWIKQDTEKLEIYCRKYEVLHSFQSDNWVTFAEFKSLIPDGIFEDSRYKSSKPLYKEVNGNQYFVKVKEFKDENDDVPLAYIEEKIEKVILYNRKVALLSEIKEKLYKREIDFKRIKIYTGD